MNNRHISFGKKVFNNTAFALIDMILLKISTTVAFILLVRLLPHPDIATIGIGMGYLVLVAYLDVGPIRVLLRDYPEISKDRNSRDQFLTALFSFWILQTSAMLLFCLGLQSFVFDKLGTPGLSFLFWGMTIDFIALTFQDWVKTIFYTDFRQDLSTKIGFIFTVFRLACLGVLFFYPSLDSYTWILIVTSIINCIVWGIALQRRFHFHPIFNRSIPGLLKKSLSEYGLWDHFNRMVIDTLLMIDTAVLSWFGQLGDIGNYTIALKFTSLFFLIPMQLHRTLQVALSNYRENSKRFEVINTFIKINALISFAQMLFVLIGGEWLIYLLFGVEIEMNVIHYVIIISIGVTIMNLSWPLMSIINNLCNLRYAFFKVFFPALLIGCAIYIGTAIIWGAIGVAYGNIATYLILTIALTIFTVKQYPFPLRFRLITAEERSLLRELMKREV